MKKKNRKKQESEQSSSSSLIVETTSLAGLSCHAHGGPFEQQEADEMVYWRNIPSDELYVSPLRTTFTTTSSSSSISNTNDYHIAAAGQQRGQQRRQYLTFEPDGGTYVCSCCILERRDVPTSNILFRV